MGSATEQSRDGSASTTASVQPPADGRCPLLQLPGDILSQIATYLDLSELVSFLTLHPILLSLTKSHLSPLPSTIRKSISAGQPYPQSLAILPHLTTLLPIDREDQGRLFIPVLVQARPKWLLERFEPARWPERVWQEAFERRYLPSWKRYKGEGDTWRATFLRMLGRLEHRNVGCTHEESWTRFVALHRNGSASINRMYSRLFDPYEIFDELKHQNNFAAHPTQIRVLLHLQDVRILAVGVLLEQPSLFVNPNGHLALHPPLLRSISTAIDDDDLPVITRVNPAQPIREVRVPRSDSRPQTSAAYGLNMAPVPFSPSSPASSTSNPLGSSPNIRSTLASLIPGRRRAGTGTSTTVTSLSDPSTDNNGLTRVTSPTQALSSSLGRLGMLTTVRSRESDDGSRRRTWSFGRTNSGSTAAPVPSVQRNPASASMATSTPDSAGTSAPAADNQGQQTRVSGESAISGISASIILEQSEAEPGPAEGTPDVPDRRQPSDKDPAADRLAYRPYPTLRKPQPASSHEYYPNFTPKSDVSVSPTHKASSANNTPPDINAASPSIHRAEPTKSDSEVIPTRDLRTDHAEVEDEFEGGLWAREDDARGHGMGVGGNGVDVWGEGGRMAEWAVDANGRGSRRRWVGPMLILAQLHPCTRSTPHPPGSDPLSSLEGAQSDLGPKGMYASLGFEDIEAIFPWISLRGSGANSWEAKRGGLGFL